MVTVQYDKNHNSEITQGIVGAKKGTEDPAVCVCVCECVHGCLEMHNLKVRFLLDIIYKNKS